MRALYGLAGQRYYVDVDWDEAEAYRRLVTLVNRFELYHDAPATLRAMNEDVLPRLAKRVRAEGGYCDVLIRCLERMAEEAELDPFCILTGDEFERRVLGAADAHKRCGRAADAVRECGRGSRLPRQRAAAQIENLRRGSFA